MIGIILGTRPELIKIYPVVSFFKKKKNSIQNNSYWTTLFRKFKQDIFKRF